MALWREVVVMLLFRLVREAEKNVCEVVRVFESVGVI